MNHAALHKAFATPLAHQDLDALLNNANASIALQPIKALQAPPGPAWYEVLLRVPCDDTLAVVTAAEAQGRADALDVLVAQTLARHAEPGVIYSLNVSGLSVSKPAFALDFWQALSGSALTPASVVIEITETARIIDFAAARAFCAMAHSLGARIAIDDIADADIPLPIEWVDVLKIDGLRMGGLTSPRSASIVDALLQLARASDRLCVVVEGVETHQELEAMALAGAHYWQGHYQHGHAIVQSPTCK